MKTCSVCKVDKDFTEYHRNIRTKDGFMIQCKSCRKKLARDRYRRDPMVSLTRTKRAECKKKGLPFDLDVEYLRELWTGICPITGDELSIGNQGCGSHKSGHLDRVVAEKGYVKGNVHFISGRMNRIKYNATLEEIEMLYNWMLSQSATTIPKGSTPQANGGGSGEPPEEE